MKGQTSGITFVAKEAESEDCPNASISHLPTRDHHDALRAGNDAGEDVERFERNVHALFAEAEREVLAEELESLDVPSVVIEGRVHHRVLRSCETYTSAVGPLTVMRTL